MNPDVSISGAVLDMQKPALDQLMAGGVAARIRDSGTKLNDKKQALPLSELYDTLQNVIWSEVLATSLPSAGTPLTEIDLLRGNLQRKHLKRAANTLIKPAATTPADSRSLLRVNANQLVSQLRVDLNRPMRKTIKAHIEDSLNTHSEALNLETAVDRLICSERPEFTAVSGILCRHQFGESAKDVIARICGSLAALLLLAG